MKFCLKLVNFEELYTPYVKLEREWNPNFFSSLNRIKKQNKKRTCRFQFSNPMG